MPDFKHKDDQNVIFDLINDPIIPGAHAIKAVLIMQFFDAVRTGFVRQRIDFSFDLLLNYGGKFAELTRHGRLENDLTIT